MTAQNVRQMYNIMMQFAKLPKSVSPCAHMEVFIIENMLYYILPQLVK